jgi:hypothetical protein
LIQRIFSLQYLQHAISGNQRLCKIQEVKPENNYGTTYIKEPIQIAPMQTDLLASWFSGLFGETGTL